MTFKNNKYVKHVLSLIILASCTTSSKNLQNQTFQDQVPKYERTLEDISEYKKFFVNDLNIIEEFLKSEELNQEDRRQIKLLKNNFKKILSHKGYVLTLNQENKYSQELIKLIYETNLPIKVLWGDTKESPLPNNLINYKLNGFCSSLQNDATQSILNNIDNEKSSTLVVFAPKYKDVVQNLISDNSLILTLQYGATNFQEFASEILEVNASKERFDRISSLSPNQKLQFSPRTRVDLKEIVLLMEPRDYKAMIPALRYHGGKNYKYLNFISALDGIDDPIQLLDYEDSFIPISNLALKKISSGEMESLKGFLVESILQDWLLIQVLRQSGTKPTYVNGLTGSVYYQTNSCSKREVPLQKITPELFSD
tara:strand:+ start:934 stop:2037 length:1104 start_codon:yes stop_codon:yes gene_type:complete